MSQQYDDTTEQLFDTVKTAIGLASLSAGRIGGFNTPSLIEQRFNFQVGSAPNLGDPPKFSDLFGVSNAEPTIARLDDQIEDWYATNFPSLASGFQNVPEDWLIAVISGSRPFGIESTVFELVWHQARDRAYRTANSEQQTLEATCSARGFSLPTGSLVSLISQAQQRATSAALDVSRDQATKDAEIKADLLKVAVQLATQYKINIYQLGQDLYKTWFGAYQLDADVQRTRSQAYSAFYNALRSFHDVEIAFKRMELEAAEAKASVAGAIDRNRVGLYGSNSAADANAQAARGFADIASASSSAAGTLVAGIEQIAAQQ